MAVLKHTHRYIRWKKETGLYRCAHPDCTHFTEKSFLLGKRSVCNLCGDEFVLTREDLLLAQPRCPNCSNRAGNKQRRKLRELVDTLALADPTDSAEGLGDPNNEII